MLRQRERHERDVILAWQIERVNLTGYQRDGSRKLPNLQKLLGRKVLAETQAQVVNAVKNLALIYNLPMEVRKATDGDR